MPLCGGIGAADRTWWSSRSPRSASRPGSAWLRPRARRVLHVAQLKNFLAGCFPDKTFVLEHGEHFKGLRAVRDRPRT